MNDEAVRSILNYIVTCLPESKYTWDPVYFEKLCYSRWAANEILEAIMDHPFTPAEETIENFILEMSVYSAFTDDSNICFRFSIAQEIAEEILQKIIITERRPHYGKSKI